MDDCGDRADKQQEVVERSGISELEAIKQKRHRRRKLREFIKNVVV